MDLIAAVRHNNVWGFINLKQEFYIEDRFAFADNFSNGFACVNRTGMRTEDPEGVLGGSFYFIDTFGNDLGVHFPAPSNFVNNFAVIEESNSRYGILDKEGHFIMNNLTSALNYSEGVAPVIKGETIGYINEEANFIIKMKHDDKIDRFSNGLARIKRNNKVGYINKSGEWIVQPHFINSFQFHDNRAAFEQNGLFGYLNEMGEIIIEPNFEDCGDFNEGVAAVKKNNKWGFINAEGKEIIPYSYNIARKFRNGFAPVMENNKVGYINFNGDYIISPQFKAAYEFCNGFAIAEENSKLGFIRENGSWVINPIYDRVNNFVDPKRSNEIFRIN